MLDLKSRARVVRQNLLASIYHARSGHPGGSLSCVDLLMAIYHFGKLNNIAASELTLILSKGHAVPAWYAVAVEFNLLDKKSLLGLRKINSKLQGHPHIETTPWVKASTGSLGQGFSVAMGMALGFKHQKSSDRVYVILGDGELQEGEVWEAAMSSGHFGLDNLCVVVDYNKMQSDDMNANIMGLEPLAEKWLSFNWNTIEINGHDFDQINDALVSAKNTLGKPTVIIAHTTKGKDISYMENIPAWHGSVTLRREELEMALRDLNASELDISEYIDGTIWERK